MGQLKIRFSEQIDTPGIYKCTLYESELLHIILKLVNIWWHNGTSVQQLPAVRDTKVLPGDLKEVPMDSFQVFLHHLLLKPRSSTKQAAIEWFTRVTRTGMATWSEFTRRHDCLWEERPGIRICSKSPPNLCSGRGEQVGDTMLGGKVFLQGGNVRLGVRLLAGKAEEGLLRFGHRYLEGDWQRVSRR